MFRLPVKILTPLSFLGFIGITMASFAEDLKTAASKTVTPYTVQETEYGASVMQGDQPVTEYHKQSKSRPILWPIWGPGQTEMTRAYPMRDGDPEEKKDHIHHRSLWIGHEINEVDFWAEEGRPVGSVKHVAFKKLSSGAQGVIEVQCDWLDPAGKKVLSDERRYAFSGPPEARRIDFDVTLIASETDLHFIDTKEGTVALRVAEWMKVDAKKGGELVNEKGEKNAEAWGKPAAWVDYTGVSPAGKEVGIAFLNHPKSFGYPTRWHVRTYGLFAANPFGVYHFEGGKEPTKGFTLEKGKRLQLNHRIVLHEGRTDPVQVKGWFEEYASENR